MRSARRNGLVDRAGGKVDDQAQISSQKGIGHDIADPQLALWWAVAWLYGLVAGAFAAKNGGAAGVDRCNQCNTDDNFCLFHKSGFLSFIDCLCVRQLVVKGLPTAVEQNAQRFKRDIACDCPDQHGL